MSNQDSWEIELASRMSGLLQALEGTFESFGGESLPLLPVPLSLSLLTQGMAMMIPPPPSLGEFLFAQAQTASMNGASSATSSSRPADSQNEITLAQRNISSREIPAQYKCSITDEVMDVPVYDPRLPAVKFDRKNIVFYLEHNLKPTHPHTRQPLKARDLVVDVVLKADIEAWMKSSLVIYSNQSASNGRLMAQVSKQLFYSESCAILGVAEGASIDEIKHAYHRNAKLLHPDRATLPEAEANQKFNQLKKAYDSLLLNKHAASATTLMLEYEHTNALRCIATAASLCCVSLAIRNVILLAAIIRRVEQANANKPASSTEDNFCGFKPGFLR